MEYAFAQSNGRAFRVTASTVSVVALLVLLAAMTGIWLLCGLAISIPFQWLSNGGEATRFWVMCLAPAAWLTIVSMTFFLGHTLKGRICKWIMIIGFTAPPILSIFSHALFWVTLAFWPVFGWDIQSREFTWRFTVPFIVPPALILFLIGQKFYSIWRAHHPKPDGPLDNLFPTI